MSAHTTRILVSEVGPRDGLQSIESVMPTEAKKAWIAAEAGSSGAWLYGGSGALLAAAFVWMSVVPLWEMWAGSGRVTAEKAPPSRPAR